MADWPTTTDPKLIGTEDLGSFTASATGSLGEQLKQLQTLIAAGTGWPYVAHPYGSGNHPLFNAQGLPFAASLNDVLLWNSQGTATLATATMTWRSADRLFTVGNTNGGISGFSVPMGGLRPTPYGLAPFKSGSNNEAGILTPTPGQTRLVAEVYGLWSAAAASSADRGIGWTFAVVGAGNFGTARHIGFYRKSGGGGWTITSGDGTTQSDTSEAADTSDGNLHWFRLEWDDVNARARLYVDGVLKVTKTTNLPAVDASLNIANFVAQAAAADATKLFEVSCGLLYVVP